MREESSWTRRLGSLLGDLGLAIADDDALEEFVLMNYQSGYTPEETAGAIFLYTCAVEAVTLGKDIERSLELNSYAVNGLTFLGKLANQGKYREELYSNDFSAIRGVCTVNEHQLDWLQRVLNDPQPKNKLMCIPSYVKKYI